MSINGQVHGLSESKRKRWPDRAEHDAGQPGTAQRTQSFITMQVTAAKLSSWYIRLESGGLLIYRTSVGVVFSSLLQSSDMSEQSRGTAYFTLRLQTPNDMNLRGVSGPQPGNSQKSHTNDNRSSLILGRGIETQESSHMFLILCVLRLAPQRGRMFMENWPWQVGRSISYRMRRTQLPAGVTLNDVGLVYQLEAVNIPEDKTGVATVKAFHLWRPGGRLKLTLRRHSGSYEFGGTAFVLNSA